MNDSVTDWTIRDGLIEYGWSRFLMAELALKSLGIAWEDGRWPDEFPGSIILDSVPPNWYGAPTGDTIRRFYRGYGRHDFIIIDTN